jgi:ribosomal protein S18 acetylase RimI-like enzyme
VQVTPFLDPKIRPAGPFDRDVIRVLIDNHDYYHHHLDWLSPVDWLEEQPYLILQNGLRENAALACPPSPPGIGWIRLFVTSRHVVLNDAWNALLHHTLEQSKEFGLELLCSLGITGWFRDLLENSGFNNLQDVVGLSIRISDSVVVQSPDRVIIREANETDIPLIAALDERAFDRIWQLPVSSMNAAFHQAGCMTVATVGDEIIGYQLSTISTLSAHLARLAVEPRMQNRQIGRMLISELFQRCEQKGVAELTVNTQSDNQSSLALYKRMGFKLSEENYPVYTLHLP